jgi:glucokinase
MEMLLAGDIGGTKTILALFDPDNDTNAPLQERRFPSDRYTSLEAIINEYLTDVAVEIAAAAFGVAGPVTNGHAQITNLPWVMDEGTLSAECNLPRVRLVNDLVATASAVPYLSAKDLETINAGEPVETGTIAVLGPGTGLGMAFLTWDGQHYQAFPSEGGHSSFSPSSEFELELLRYLFKKFNGHVSTERVASGSGIPNLYSYFRDSGYAAEPHWLAEAIAAAEDPTPIIVQNAQSDNPHDLCVLTLDTFVSILGAESADVALTYLATGGVYLAGGIPPRILNTLKSEHFYRPFVTKGRFSNLMKRIPVQSEHRTSRCGAGRYDIIVEWTFPAVLHTLGACNGNRNNWSRKNGQ